MATIHKILRISAPFIGTSTENKGIQAVVRDVDTGEVTVVSAIVPNEDWGDVTVWKDQLCGVDPNLEFCGI